MIDFSQIKKIIFLIVGCFIVCMVLVVSHRLCLFPLILIQVSLHDGCKILSNILKNVIKCCNKLGLSFAKLRLSSASQLGKLCYTKLASKELLYR